MNEKKNLIIDIETTGFLKDGGKLVEVGIVELNLENGEKKILFDKVTHEKGVTKEEVEKSWIVEISDLTVEDVRHSKRWDLLKGDVQKIIDSYPLGVTAFNSAFDFTFLETKGINFPKKLACPMLLSTNVLKLKGYYGNYKWPTVNEAYNFYFPESKFVEKHRGADDAFHEADIVYELYKSDIFKLKS